MGTKLYLDAKQLEELHAKKDPSLDGMPFEDWLIHATRDQTIATDAQGIYFRNHRKGTQNAR